MRAKEFIIENIELDELLYPAQVNKTIQKTGDGKWVAPGGGKIIPIGATGSVWQHLDDPDKVVKVVGGGRWRAEKHHLDSTVAFVDFLVHNGYKSPHFPIVHGIDVGADVVQVRVERLYPINRDVGWLLDEMSDGFIGPTRVREYDRLVKRGDIDPNKNSFESIKKCIKLLNDARSEYKNKYKLPNLILDLHSGNWLQRSDGTIVAADPWYSRGAS